MRVETLKCHRSHRWLTFINVDQYVESSWWVGTTPWGCLALNTCQSIPNIKFNQSQTHSPWTTIVQTFKFQGQIFIRKRYLESPFFLNLDWAPFGPQKTTLTLLFTYEPKQLSWISEGKGKIFTMLHVESHMVPFTGMTLAHGSPQWSILGLSFTNMIAEQSIPVYTTLCDVFGSLTASLEHVSRWNNLAEEFEKRFGKKPSYIARAPGRIKYVKYPNISRILFNCLSYSSLIGGCI